MADQSVQVFAFASAPGDRIRSRRVVIDGSSYVCLLEYRPLVEEDTGGLWFFSLSTTAGEAVILGQPLRDRTDLLYGIASPVRPPGAIIPYNPTVRGDDPRAGAFESDGWLLCYFPDGYVPEDFAISLMAG